MMHRVLVYISINTVSRSVSHFVTYCKGSSRDCWVFCGIVISILELCGTVTRGLCELSLLSGMKNAVL